MDPQKSPFNASVGNGSFSACLSSRRDECTRSRAFPPFRAPSRQVTSRCLSTLKPVGELFTFGREHPREERQRRSEGARERAFLTDTHRRK